MTKVNGGIITILPSTVITTALTGQAQTALDDSTIDFLSAVSSISVEAIFTYGSAGTTVKAWLQTSLDGGTTWFDIANFAFTTASASKLSAITTHIAPVAQAATPTDATLADNTINQGILGDRFRIKLTTTGTYATSTTLKIVMIARM